MFNIGAAEVIVILVVALVIFGPKKLPELGKALGSFIKEFKDATDTVKKNIETESSTTGSSQKNNS